VWIGASLGLGLDPQPVFRYAHLAAIVFVAAKR